MGSRQKTSLRSGPTRSPKKTAAMPTATAHPIKAGVLSISNSMLVTKEPYQVRTNRKARPTDDVERIANEPAISWQRQSFHENYRCKCNCVDKQHQQQQQRQNA